MSVKSICCKTELTFKSRVWHKSYKFLPDIKRNISEVFEIISESLLGVNGRHLHHLNANEPTDVLI